MALWREMFYLVESGVATVRDIDMAISNGPGLRWALLGPFLNLHASGGDGGITSVLQRFAMRELARTLGDYPATDDYIEVMAEVWQMSSPDTTGNRCSTNATSWSCNSSQPRRSSCRSRNIKLTAVADVEPIRDRFSRSVEGVRSVREGSEGYGLHALIQSWFGSEGPFAWVCQRFSCCPSGRASERPTGRASRQLTYTDCYGGQTAAAVGMAVMVCIRGRRASDRLPRMRWPRSPSSTPRRERIALARRRILSVVATHTLPAIVPRWLKLACVAFRELRWQGLQTWFGSFLAA
jgi:3-hydroxyacyl-CoA dehydrogenase, C-terminal domain